MSLVLDKLRSGFDWWFSDITFEYVLRLPPEDVPRRLRSADLSGWEIVPRGAIGLTPTHLVLRRRSPSPKSLLRILAPHWLIADITFFLAPSGSRLIGRIRTTWRARLRLFIWPVLFAFLVLGPFHVQLLGLFMLWFGLLAVFAFVLHCRDTERFGRFVARTCSIAIEKAFTGEIELRDLDVSRRGFEPIDPAPPANP
jgi:hypothetical protein